MRKYAAFYMGGFWMVIYQDEGEIEWYCHTPNAGSKDNANQIARLITTAEESY